MGNILGGAIYIREPTSNSGQANVFLRIIYSYFIFAINTRNTRLLLMDVTYHAVELCAQIVVCPMLCMDRI